MTPMNKKNARHNCATRAQCKVARITSMQTLRVDENSNGLAQIKIKSNRYLLQKTGKQSTIRDLGSIWQNLPHSSVDIIEITAGAGTVIPTKGNLTTSG